MLLLDSNISHSVVNSVSLTVGRTNAWQQYEFYMLSQHFTSECSILHQLLNYFSKWYVHLLIYFVCVLIVFYCQNSTIFNHLKLHLSFPDTEWMLTFLWKCVQQDKQLMHKHHVRDYRNPFPSQHCLHYLVLCGGVCWISSLTIFFLCDFSSENESHSPACFLWWQIITFKYYDKVGGTLGSLVQLLLLHPIKVWSGV